MNERIFLVLVGPVRVRFEINPSRVANWSQVQEKASSSEQDNGIGSDSSKDLVVHGDNVPKVERVQTAERRVGGWKTTPFIFGKPIFL